MKGLIALILGIVVALLIVGGAVAYVAMHETVDSPQAVDSTINKVNDKVAEVISTDDVSGSESSSSDSNVVSEKVKFNAQMGDGYYREVTYSDGGMRQYDTESGELIGSTYDSDQDQLPNME